MVRNVRLMLTIILTSLLFIFVLTLLIVFNSPYYPGFEGGLDYLSSDLSENRFIIRDEVTINKNSKIKIIFEDKDRSIYYDREQFNQFINNLEIRVWRDNQYFEFQSHIVEFEDVELYKEITIGEIHETGKYIIFIKSNSGRNSSYHIGVGIGRTSKIPPVSKNRRAFY